MRNFFGWAILGSAMLLVGPASASTTNYNFVFTDGLNGTYSNAIVTTKCSSGTNGQCTNNSDLSSYSVAPQPVGTPAVTATAVAFYATGTSAGPTSDLTSALVGEYTSDGLGICETDSGTNCTSPNHQVNNGADTTSSGGNGSGADNFEFMLIQFSGAAVNLSDITLGNFGTTGSTSSPFNATYLTSTSTDTLAQMEAALGATTVGGLANTNGFGTAQQTSCNNSECAVNDVGANDPLTGTGVTYLLIGASDVSGAAGTDFFKIQDLAASYTTTGVSPTPEPATFGLLGLALTGLGVYGRKRKSGRS